LRLWVARHGWALAGILHVFPKRFLQEEMNMTKVLVVGGAGYVGGAVSELLTMEKIPFSVYDSLVYEPHYLSDVLVQSMLKRIEKFKHRVKRDIILPRIKWNEATRETEELKLMWAGT
jgi:hypothetical protein